MWRGLLPVVSTQHELATVRREAVDLPEAADGKVRRAGDLAAKYRKKSRRLGVHRLQCILRRRRAAVPTAPSAAVVCGTWVSCAWAEVDFLFGAREAGVLCP